MMPTLKDQVIDLLNRNPGLTDREITDLVKGRREPQQAVNIACRSLATNGIVERRTRQDGLIGNYLTEGPPPADSAALKPIATANAADIRQDLSEDEVKKHLASWLEIDGWTVTVRWGKDRGLDIDAARNEERWCIEVKGSGSLQAMRVNYFLAILGETLQRMSDPEARYSIALPDMAQFRGLWSRLPHLAKERTRIAALFVAADGTVSNET